MVLVLLLVKQFITDDAFAQAGNGLFSVRLADAEIKNTKVKERVYLKISNSAK